MLRTICALIWLERKPWDEMMVVANKYYDEVDQGMRELQPGDMKRKHWDRWLWYISARVTASGEFVNLSRELRSAYKQEQRKWSNRSTVSEWEEIGPVMSTLGNGSLNGLGRVDRIAFDPGNSNIIYPGTPAGGLWRTVNGGASWTPLTDNIPMPSISGIVVSHANPNTIYILTGDGDSWPGAGWGYIRPSIGVLKSTDGGLTWSQTGPLGNQSQINYGLRLVQDPNKPDTLFAATENGLFRTANGGATWSNVLAHECYDVAYKPGSSTVIYASTPGKVWRTSSGGYNSSQWSESSLDTVLGRRSKN